MTLRQSATVLPLDRDSIGGFLPMFAAFGLILLIACANVSNMMLARGLARQREIGIRISLGAGRARMVRQLLTESLLLAIPAALAAFVVAHGTIQAALWIQMNVLHADQMWSVGLWNAAPDLRVLAFLLATAGIATLGFGLMPAIQASRSRLVEANRGEFANDYRPARLRSALVVAQVTVCALLLISAGVALRSERRLASQDFGADARGIFTVSLNRSVNADQKFRQPVMERLLSLSRTASLGVCRVPPGSPSPWARVVSGNGTIDVPFNQVSPEYFGVYGIAIRGRNFSTAEAEAGAPVVIVSETAARRLWPRGDALGQTLNLKDSVRFYPDAGGKQSFRTCDRNRAGLRLQSLHFEHRQNPDSRASVFPEGLEDKRHVLHGGADERQPRIRAPRRRAGGRSGSAGRGLDFLHARAFRSVFLPVAGAGGDLRVPRRAGAAADGVRRFRRVVVRHDAAEEGVRNSHRAGSGRGGASWAWRCGSRCGWRRRERR